MLSSTSEMQLRRFIIGLFLILLLLLNGCYRDNIKHLIRSGLFNRSRATLVLRSKTSPTDYDASPTHGPYSTDVVSATGIPSLAPTMPEICKAKGILGRLVISYNDSKRTYWNLMGTHSTVNHTETSLGNFVAVKVSNHEAVYVGQKDCVPNQWVAIIIPFRKRESHLKILLGHLTPILKRQSHRYSIFVVEQLGSRVFNKGRVMNTGFKYATAVGEQNGTPFDCFVFHDVDMLTENDRLTYKCSGGNIVDHFAVAINKFNYRMCCGLTVGGVLAIPSELFYKVNGFSNSFWGWGGEDDAMYHRIRARKLQIRRPNAAVGRFTMIEHDRDKSNPVNRGRLGALQKDWKRIDEDGLKNLNTTVMRVDKYPFFTRVYVDVGEIG